MKKKILATLIASATLLSLAACSSNKSASKGTSSTPASSETSKSSSSSSSSSSSKATSSASKSNGNSDTFNLMIEAAQSQVASLKAQMGSTYSDISISAGESDTVVYTFTYAKKIPVNVDSTSLKPVLVKGMKSTMDSLKALVPDVKIKVIYLNPDKSKVADILITQADTDAVSS